MKDRVAIVLTAATALLHLAVAGRYDVFRDELYFIVCGRHPQWGYADQPPLVPLLSAALFSLHEQLWILRLADVAAAAALVFVAVKFARTLGGGDGAAWIAGMTCGVAPVLMGIDATVNTTVFEPLAWTFVAYAVARAALHDDRRILLWAGVVAGLAMEAKYALPIWLLGIVVGLVLTPQRRLLRLRELWLGVAIALVIALPSVLWQAANGWPFVTLVHAAADKNVDISLLPFFGNQVLVLNPLFAPVWLAGLIAPFVARSLRPLIFVPVAYVVVTAAIVAGHGKDYYLAPAIPSLFAIGAVAWVRIVKWGVVRALYLALAVANSAVIAPLALPILPPAQIVPYMQALHVVPQAQEKLGQSTLMPQEFADQLGWHDFVREVAAAWAQIPPAQRASTSIYVDNYGEAAALDVYGPAYGLPSAVTGHNQYGLWGLRGQDPRNVLRVHNEMESAIAKCDGVRLLGTTSSPYAMHYENGKVIFYCPNVHPPLRVLFLESRHLD